MTHRTNASRTVDQDATHGLGRDREEVRSVIPLDAGLVNELEKCLVNQGVSVERMVNPLSAELSMGHAPETFVDRLEEALAGQEIPGPPGEELVRDAWVSIHLRLRVLPHSAAA
jgi:hypothetical protein